MDVEENKPEPTVEQLLIIMACTLQLRGDNLELEELLFLKTAIDKGISDFRRKIH